MALTRHIKRTVVDVSKPEGDPQRVVHEFYTDVEWAALEPAYEAQRVERSRAGILLRLKQAVAEQIEKSGDEMHRMEKITTLLDLKTTAVRTVDEEAQFQTLKAEYQWARQVAAEYRTIRDLVTVDPNPESVREPIWPAHPDDPPPVVE